MERARVAGYTKPFSSLERGAFDHVRHYLGAEDPNT
jgi:hypothetical protein